MVDDKSSPATWRQLYNACVPSVLLYRSECWTTLCSDLRHLGAFHNQRLGAILKISTKEQKCICLTSAQLWSRFGDEKRVAEKARSLHVAHDFGGRTSLSDIFWQPVMHEIGSDLLQIADVGKRRL